MKFDLYLKLTLWALTFSAHESVGLDLRRHVVDAPIGVDEPVIDELGLMSLRGSGKDAPVVDTSAVITKSFSGADSANSQECSFELYDPKADVLRTVDPARVDVVFNQGAVYVVDGKTNQDGTYQRYLTFNQGAGGSAGVTAFSNFFAGSGANQLMQPKCREQVQVTCKSASASTSPGGCDTKQCQPNVRDNAVPEYRVLLGSALSGREHLGRVAVLGFGAGIVPAALAQSHPEATIEAVDISGDVLAAAGCFGVVASDKMKLVEKDARAYMEDLDDGILDMLFVDVYDDKANIPPCFTTMEFFALAKRKLAERGTLAMNLVTHELQNVLPAVSASFSTMQLGTLSSDQGNNVLLAFSGKEAPSPAAEVGADTHDFSSLFAAWAQDGVFAAVPRTSTAARTDESFCK
jgi:predicted O-methyltransferase YrrM